MVRMAEWQTRLSRLRRWNGLDPRRGPSQTHLLMHAQSPAEHDSQVLHARRQVPGAVVPWPVMKPGFLSHSPAPRRQAYSHLSRLPIAESIPVHHPERTSPSTSHTTEVDPELQTTCRTALISAVPILKPTGPPSQQRAVTIVFVIMLRAHAPAAAHSRHLSCRSSHMPGSRALDSPAEGRVRGALNSSTWICAGGAALRVSSLACFCFL